MYIHTHTHTHTHTHAQSHHSKVKPDSRQMKSHLGDLSLVFILCLPFESSVLKEHIDRE